MGGKGELIALFKPLFETEERGTRRTGELSESHRAASVR
jgi:predicted rRNA methylase YqxC with S4 and FtsJ domains